MYVRVRVNVCMYACTSCIHVYIHTYIYIYTYMHTYIHTRCKTTSPQCCKSLLFFDPCARWNQTHRVFRSNVCSSAPQRITLHCITLHHITVHYITSHCITVHHIALTWIVITIHDIVIIVMIPWSKILYYLRLAQPRNQIHNAIQGGHCVLETAVRNSLCYDTMIQKKLVHGIASWSIHSPARTNYIGPSRQAV